VPPEATYSFGDSAIAAERLEIVAATFEPATRTLLGSRSVTPRRVLDLGPGPGHTTALLAELYPGAELVAVELSESYAAQAAARVPQANVIVGDPPRRSRTASISSTRASCSRISPTPTRLLRTGAVRSLRAAAS
jgi:protein-L-isoaspartate O-methyltransferase